MAHLSLTRRCAAVCAGLALSATLGITPALGEEVPIDDGLDEGIVDDTGDAPEGTYGTATEQEVSPKPGDSIDQVGGGTVEDTVAENFVVEESFASTAVVVSDAYDGIEEIDYEPELYAEAPTEPERPIEPTVPDTVVDTLEEDYLASIIRGDLGRADAAGPEGPNKSGAVSEPDLQTDTRTGEASKPPRASTATAAEKAAARKDVMASKESADKLRGESDDANAELPLLAERKQGLADTAVDELRHVRNAAYSIFESAVLADDEPAQHDAYDAYKTLNGIDLPAVFKKPAEIDPYLQNAGLSTYFDALRKIKSLAEEFVGIDLDAAYEDALETYKAARKAYDAYADTYDRYYDLLICESDWTPVKRGTIYVRHIKEAEAVEADEATAEVAGSEKEARDKNVDSKADVAKVTEEGAARDNTDNVASARAATTSSDASDGRHVPRHMASATVEMPATRDDTPEMLPVTIALTGGLVATLGMARHMKEQRQD